MVASTEFDVLRESQALKSWAGDVGDFHDSKVTNPAACGYALK